MAKPAQFLNPYKLVDTSFSIAPEHAQFLNEWGAKGRGKSEFVRAALDDRIAKLSPPLTDEGDTTHD